MPTLTHDEIMNTVFGRVVPDQDPEICAKYPALVGAVLRFNGEDPMGVSAFAKNSVAEEVQNLFVASALLYQTIDQTKHALAKVVEFLEIHSHDDIAGPLINLQAQLQMAQEIAQGGGEEFLKKCSKSS